MSDWQPIESAPMDGTVILAFGTGTDAMAWPAFEKMPPMMATVRWHCLSYEDFEEQPDGTFVKVQKAFKGYWKPFSVGFFNATHWMPLPSPPGTETGIPVYKVRDATEEVLGGEEE